MNISDWIDVKSGQFISLPLRVEVVLRAMAEGDNMAKLAIRFPGLKAEHVEAALEYSACLMANPDGEAKYRLTALENWRSEVEKHLHSDVREEVHDLIRQTRAWRVVINKTLTYLGLGSALTVCVITLVINWIVQNEVNRAQQTVKNAEDRLMAEMTRDLDKSKAAMDSRVNELASTLDKRIKDTLSQDNLVEKGTAEIRKELGSTLDLQLRLFAEGVANAIDLHLRNQMLQPNNISDRFFDADQIQDLEYSVNAIVSEYRDKLAIGAVEPTRRRALFVVLDGIMERALARTPRAIEDFKKASLLDPGFFEAKVLLARVYAEEQAYDSNSHSFVLARRKEIQALYDQVNDQWGKHPPIGEVARWIPEVLLQLGRYEEAITAAQYEIEAESRFGGGPDVRLYRRLADAKARKAIVAGDEKLRHEAASDMLLAVNPAPDYLKAANNYLWYVTHRTDDSLLPREEMTPEERQGAAKVLQRFAAEAIVYRYAYMLNTLAESYAVLGDTDSDRANAEKWAADAVVLAQNARGPTPTTPTTGPTTEPTLNESVTESVKSRIAPIHEYLQSRASTRPIIRPPGSTQP